VFSIRVGRHLHYFFVTKPIHKLWCLQWRIKNLFMNLFISLIARLLVQLSDRLLFLCLFAMNC
jgi:hypothetical protein